MSVARAIRANYADLRGWAIFAQLFLGVGWLRACVAHALESAWWDGTELRGFVSTHAAESVDAYRPFVEELVLQFPAPISWAVLSLELLTAILLISNVRAEIGLTIGGFLNVQFILAGQVNPSVFYLVAAIGLLLWRLEKVATPRNARYHTRRSVTLAVLTIIVFGPSIRTVDPAFAMEDPALVIIFLACLTAATIWLSEPSTSLAIADTENDPTRANDTRGSDTRDDDTDKDGAKPMVLDLQDLSEATIESTLPMMLSLKQMEGISSLPHRQRSTIANSDEEADDDEQQPRIRDLAPLPTEPVSGEHDDESSDRREDGLEDEPYVEVVDIV